jgi:hypothetical protein
MATNGQLNPGATGSFSLINSGNNVYITANVFITISDISDKSAYYQVISINHSTNTMVIQNVSNFLTGWSSLAHVAMLGPRGATGATGVAGPTGPNVWTQDANNNISYTSGTTKVSTLYVNNTNYNRLPMGMLSQTQIGPTGTNNITNASAFPTATSGNLVASTTFDVIGVTGSRKIRTHINLNVEDITSATNNNLYFTLYDGSTLINRYTHAYRSGNLCTSLNLYNYSSVAVDTSKTYHLYATSTTSGASISANTGTYSSLAAPASFITVEDIGLS